MEEILKKMNEMEDKRQKERMEDKEALKVLATGFQDVVKREMEDAMQPWKERTVRVEEKTAEMGEDMRKLTAEVRGLREQMSTRQEERSYAGVTEHVGARHEGARHEGVRFEGARHGGVVTGANAVPIGAGGIVSEDQEEKQRIRTLLGEAKRVVGLKPMDKLHVEHTKKRLAAIEGETEDEKEMRAKKGAVIFFLKAEMKMKEDDIAKLDIVKIFAPAREEWNTLYVELGTWEQARFLLSFTSYLRRGTAGEDRLEVIKYIPRDLFARFKAINAMGNKARIDSDKTINFRVGFGSEDFILQQKPRGSKGWGPPLPLPADLPGFEHHVALPRGDRSPGAAPGRPALTPEQQARSKRTREEGGSPSSPSSTTPRSKRLETADLVGSPTISPVKAGEGLLAAAASTDIGSFDSFDSITPAAATTETLFIVKTRSKKAIQEKAQ